MKSLGRKLTDMELDAIFAAADQDGNGSVEFGEFLATIAKEDSKQGGSNKPLNVTEKELAEVFEVFDKVSSASSTAAAPTM